GSGWYDKHDSILFSVILRFGNKNFANLGSSFFDTPTILTSYLEQEHHWSLVNQHAILIHRILRTCLNLLA
ncbi:hypothetical protein, partial [Xenorhabdus sp. Sc-CR9]|uniref:hypothetical protein n=1 Tax=Xenorhabdus sp. Sc-CR9 TaxID=2584468 RepID=UPI001F1F7BE0